MERREWESVEEKIYGSVASGGVLGGMVSGEK